MKASFVNDMFGSDEYSYANIVLDSGNAVPIAFKQKFIGNLKSYEAIVLDTTSSIESKLSKSSTGSLQHELGSYTLYGCSSEDGTFYVQYASAGVVNDVQQNQSTVPGAVNRILKLENDNEYALQT